MQAKIEEEALIKKKDGVSLAIVSLMSAKVFTPSYLSYLLFLAILPAGINHYKSRMYNLINDKEGQCTKKSIIDRSYQTYYRMFKDSWDEKENGNIEFNINDAVGREYSFCRKTHKFHAELYNGLETLDVSLINSTGKEKYSLCCVGNAEDAMLLRSVKGKVQEDKTRNYVFWNYPGVAGSSGKATPREVIDAGVSQVRRLLAKGVKPHDITVDGHSIGGGVAVQVVNKLYQQGIFVNLNIDRSFANLELVVTEFLKSNNLDRPLVSAFLTCGVIGLTSGFAFAGSMASFATGFHKMLDFIGLNSLGYILDKAINVIGSIVGGLMAVGGLLVGTVTGLCLGAVLEFGNLFVKIPDALIMKTALRVALYVACCEMNSQEALHQALDIVKYNDEDVDISVVTTTKDEIIPFAASLQNAFVGKITDTDGLWNDEQDESDDESDDEDDDLVTKSKRGAAVTFRQHDHGDHNQYISKDSPSKLDVFKK